MYDQVAMDWQRAQGITPVADGQATFDPYAYADPDARYNAWVAAGKPSRGKNSQYGEFELTNTGMDSQTGFRNAQGQPLDAFNIALGDTSNPLLPSAPGAVPKGGGPSNAFGGFVDTKPGAPSNPAARPTGSTPITGKPTTNPVTDKPVGTIPVNDKPVPTDTTLTPVTKNPIPGPGGMAPAPVGAPGPVTPGYNPQGPQLDGTRWLSPSDQRKPLASPVTTNPVTYTPSAPYLGPRRGGGGAGADAVTTNPVSGRDAAGRPPADLVTTNTFADGGRARPDAPLTLGDNGDVGPAIYMNGREAASRYAILPKHSSVNETSEGHMFSDGSGNFSAGGRAKKRSGDADGTGIPPVGLADGGRIPYSEYERRNKHPDSFYRDAGVAPPADGGLPFTQATWDALPLAQQYGNLGGDGTIVSHAGHNIAVNGVQGSDGWVTVYGQPGLYGHPPSEWLDPSGLRDNGDGTFSFDPEKINGTRLAQYQDTDAQTGALGRQPWITGIATVVGGGLLAGAMGAGAETLGAGLAGDESAGLAMSNPFAGVAADESAGLSMGNPFADASGALNESAGLDMTNPFSTDPSGAFEANYPGNQPITPEQLQQVAQQNPSWWDSVTQGARQAGSSVVDFLRANPGLARVGLSLVGALIGSNSPHAPGANTPSGNGPPTIPQPGVPNPGGGPPGGGAPGGGSATQQHSLDLQNQLATEFANNYRDVYLPQQRRTIDEANAIGGEDDQARARERAVGDVANTYGAARGTILRNLSRYGLGATSGQAQAGLNRATLDEAGARAGQSNVAVDRAITGGRTARANLLAMLNGTGSLASSGANAAASTANTMRTNDLTSRGQDITREVGLRGQDVTQRGQDIGRELGLAGVNINQQGLDAAATARRNNGYGNILDSVGNWLFGKAQGGRIIDGEATQVPNDGELADATEGGAVHGPGTETSDDVPARLSKGEIVINADSVKMIDEVAPGLLDKVNELGLKKRAMQSGVAYA